MTLPPGIFAGATTVVADLCGLAGQIGAVAHGAPADLLVVEGAPLVEIAVLADPMRNILMVMKGGSVHRRHDL